MTAGIEPFRVHVPDEALTDLADRLARTRWSERETVDDWSQGLPLAYAQELCAHWRSNYDWRATEARLNALPQVRVRVDGLGIHAIHVRSRHERALPLLITHGWPGSVVELLDVIGPLVDPPDPADAFHVVCPSLPGFGYSEKPSSGGWTVEHIARAWTELMARLGYRRYAAHGTDWGSFVTVAMGERDRGALAGIHVTMPFARPPQHDVELSELDLAGLAAMKVFQAQEGGYSAIQSTRPQTIGYGLTDSPAAQLAWIVEKYWAWSDHDGDVEKVIPRGRLLDAVSVAWLTATGASSARIYWESHSKTGLGPVAVPTAVANYPKDGRMPRPWIETRFSDIRSWKDHPSGGHFPALEQPDTLVTDLREFVGPLR